MKKRYLIAIVLIFIIAFSIVYSFMNNGKIIDTINPIPQPTQEEKRWEVRSVDTMKFSRDPSREKLNDPEYDKVINNHVAEIASMSANFIAIGTPYDDEFGPILRRWVKAARKHDLKIWFRGNLSGWEGWFGYPRIDRAQHIAGIEQFILNNSDIFEDGDIFTSCPECENGIKIEWGDPASLAQHREFLINEHNVALAAFKKINKNVESGYYSMNGDLARALMDRETTSALGGVIVVDHYVPTVEKLARDLREYAEKSGGKVLLGEFGAPIPDLHGDMSPEEQNKWISDALYEISKIPQVIGMNYWVSHGGSTALWDSEGNKKPAVDTITEFYSGKRKNYL